MAINTDTHNQNPGIVPPYIGTPSMSNRNPGIVPPYLQDGIKPQTFAAKPAAYAGLPNPAQPGPYSRKPLAAAVTTQQHTGTPSIGTNPGIVPPWLTGRTAVASATTTDFVRQPIDFSPLLSSGYNRF